MPKRRRFGEIFSCRRVTQKPSLRLSPIGQDRSTSGSTADIPRRGSSFSRARKCRLSLCELRHACGRTTVVARVRPSGVGRIDGFTDVIKKASAEALSCRHRCEHWLPWANPPEAFEPQRTGGGARHVAGESRRPNAGDRGMAPRRRGAGGLRSCFTGLRIAPSGSPTICES